MSTSESLCSIVLEDSDLKKLEELDPNLCQGFRSFCQLTVPVLIAYTNELDQTVEDLQSLTAQLLVRTTKTSLAQKNALTLESLQIYLTSQTDLHFNFVSNCSKQTFESLKSKNSLNIDFNDFPNIICSMLKNTGESRQNQLVLLLSYEGTGRLQVFQRTEYKKLELIDLFFNRSSIEKAHQSIIYRFNYQKSKLAMLENSICSIYEILRRKNLPLLQYIQSNVGINE